MAPPNVASLSTRQALHARRWSPMPRWLSPSTSNTIIIISASAQIISRIMNDASGHAYFYLHASTPRSASALLAIAALGLAWRYYMAWYHIYIIFDIIMFYIMLFLHTHFSNAFASLLGISLIAAILISWFRFHNYAASFVSDITADKPDGDTWLIEERYALIAAYSVRRFSI